jgi:hypothetical protein
VLEAALARACVALQLEAAEAWRPIHAALRRLSPASQQQRPRRDATRRLIALWDYQARATAANARVSPLRPCVADKSLAVRKALTVLAFAGRAGFPPAR